MDLVLHIGAHRTGSTLIEQAITETVCSDPDCGVAIWPPRRLRDMEGFQAATRHFDSDAEPLVRASAQALDDLASRLARAVAVEREKGTRRLIVSEENLLGGMRNNLYSGVFYPDVEQRLACYDSLFPMSPLSLAIGVRDYGDVWTSAFHYLPQSGQEQPKARQARGGLLEDKRGWPDVIAEARSVWPDAACIAWQQETLSEDATAIVAAITGLPEDKIQVPAGKVNARKAQAAQSELFNEDERKHLSHRYNRHLRRLQSDGVHWAGRGRV